jgi:4-diphosphocytidyl-2-C-methyl-D-erythritol kinase
MLTEDAPAKINLTLHVTGRRADGYHLLDSLVVFAGARDQVGAAPADGLSLAVTGPFAAALADDPDNLVLRAARALAAKAGVPANASLTLAKHLPVASGIGGGSTDAAAALRVLARLWRLEMAETALEEIAVGLGADVPVCLACVPRRMTGIGEILAPAPTLPDAGLVLVNPGIAVPTPAVFRARTGAFTEAQALPDGWPTARAMAEAVARGGNDLQEAAINLCPAIGTVLNALRAVPGCLLARMSGSGATCFALFEAPEEAARAAAGLARPGWWCWGGPLYDRGGAT